MPVVSSVLGDILSPFIMAILGYLTAIVKPEMAGIVGSVIYMMAQNRLGKLSFGSLPFILLMGYVGSWVVTHFIAIDLWTGLSHGGVQLLSGISGFMAYDFVLTLAGQSGAISSSIKDAIVNRATTFIKGSKG